MDFYSVNVFQRECGNIWQNRSRSGLTSRRPLLSVSNKCHCYEDNTCKRARFVHVAVDQGATRLAAGDRHGHIYLFHLQHNRFWLVSRLGSCSTALSFSPLPERDLLVATADCSLHIFETVQRRRVGQLDNHTTCISNISTDSEGRRFLTCSLKTALVWDLLTFAVLHQLNFHLQENLTKCQFVFPGDVFLTALKEDRILVWSSTTFDPSRQLKTLPGSAIRVMDVSSDGELVAAGGRTSWLQVWKLRDESQEEPLVLSMASADILSIRHLAFMPRLSSTHGDNTHVLGVVSHEGNLHFYEVETGSHMTKLDLSGDSITAFKSPLDTSWKFVLLTQSGKMLLYDLDHILRSETVQMERQETRAKPMERREDLVPEGPNHLGEATVARLKGIVKEFGQYPDKYRYLIWRSLLDLPNNQSAFLKLSQDPPPLKHASYPVTNTTISRALQRVLSMLCKWCPRLSEIPDLPLLVFPFVKLFYQNLHFCLELLIVFISKWCGNWFGYYPSPPFRILSATENLLSHHDPRLLLHYIRHGVTAETYSWLLLKSVFSEVMSREMWLHVFDHVFSTQPSFQLYLVVAFNMLCRQQLLKLSELSQFQTFFHSQQNLSVRDLVRKAYLLEQNTPQNNRDACCDAIGTFSPVSVHKGTYTSFNNFPNVHDTAMGEVLKSQERMEYMKTRQNKLLNMKLDEEVKLCRCTPEIPKIIRCTTCSCVQNPYGYRGPSESLNPSIKENVQPNTIGKATVPKRIDGGFSPQKLEGGVARGPDQRTNQVIQRVLQVRKDLSSQWHNT